MGAAPEVDAAGDAYRLVTAVLCPDEPVELVTPPGGRRDERPAGRREALWTLDNRLLYCVNVGRSRHPSKIVEEAVRYAESSGWTYKPAGKSAHAWGFLLCPGACPQFAVWSTPRVPEHHARAILRAVDRCPHPEGEPE